MGSLLWLLYEAGLGLALLVAGPFLLARRGRHYLPTLAGRLGGGGDAGGGAGAGAGGVADRSAGGAAAAGGLWLHAVSVGEVGVAATLARALPPELPLLVTTVTPTGQALARRAFAGRARVAYLPFDLRPAVGRFWRRFQPAALVLIEGDYWPLLLREAKRRGLPVAVVNGRVGDRSFGRLRRLRPLAGLLFACVERFGLQSAEDRGRLQALGVDASRLTVTGNLKFETAEPRANRALAAAIRRLAGGRPVLVAGSTMPGEEEQVLAAFGALGGGSRALLVLAPRHPERWDEVERLLRAGGLGVARRSRMRGVQPSAAQPAPWPVDGAAAVAVADPAAVLSAGPAAGPTAGPAAGPTAGPGAGTAAGASAPAAAGSAAGSRAPAAASAIAGREVRGSAGLPDAVLLDSLGELAALYQEAAAAFVGGTLVGTGGHNPLEPARFGIPIAAGPSMHNFRDMAERFDRAGAWRRVANAAQLGRVWHEWLADSAAARAQGERAAALLAENRGALARTLEMLAPILAGLAPPLPAGTVSEPRLAPKAGGG
jgi:3-deoxy-D-manno-octulosonic-acid transferase